MKRVVDFVTGEDLPITGLSGSTDVAHTVKVTGMASAGFGVGRAQESHGHGDDENARVEDILNLVKVVAALATGAVE